MTGETRMSFFSCRRKGQTVPTARRLAECSRKWRTWKLHNSNFSRFWL